MAICPFHTYELDSLCACSMNHSKGIALANTLQNHSIQLVDFWNYIQKEYNMTSYSIKNHIEFDKDHTLVAREMVSSGIWNKLYDIIKRYNGIEEFTPIFDF